MKNFILMVMSVLLFTGCYSYIKIDISSEEIVIGEKYQIKTFDDSLGREVTVEKVNDSINGMGHSGRQVSFAKSDIKDIKKVEFSVVKTVIPIVVLTGALIIIGLNNQPDFQLEDEN